MAILSHVSEAGSPMNRSGSDKTQGQGSFAPSTGGPDLQGSLQPDYTLVESGLIHIEHLTISKLDNHLDKKFEKERTAHLIHLFY